MAVSINTVYQRVLGILNKEQRGYVTPQEFNLFANQAQMDLFEQYFYDINQFGRVPGNSTAFSDMLDILNEKISIFQTSANPPTRTGNFFDEPADMYRLGTVVYNNETTNNFGVTTTEPIEAERINSNEFLYINSSPLTKPTNTMPIYLSNSQGIRVYGDSEITALLDVEFQYIKKPATVEWGYQIVFDEALYNSATTTDFELHPSEEVELVIKILELSGILIKDLNLYQVFDKEEMQTIQQEKA
tara:strand:- start:3433 stop:4167 length:735 start_codon:yes stop_codon:yes gene_type:complete